MTSLNILFHPQGKNINFTVTGEKINQKLFTFKELESKKFDIFCMKKNTQTDE